MLELDEEKLLPMVNEYNDDPPQDEPDVDVEDLDVEPEPEPEVDVAALQREVEELRARDSQRDRDLKSAIGRWQSSLDKLESGRGDTDALAAQAQGQFEAVNAAFDALLSDETIAPETRARVQQARDRAKSDTDLATMKAQLEALQKQRREPDNASSASVDRAALTSELEEWITDEGLEPDNPLFDWRGEATQILNAQGPAAVRSYFRKQIKAAKDADAAAKRRQSRKEAAGDSPPAAGNELRELDPSKPLEERIKVLQAKGII